ncbi:MAG: transcriptional repressor LexA [Candidatus Sumerlaeia bacterium]|nr:transcriptional repressor LexA [Candidatus Sumerlaeia bacterium]
MYLTRRQREVFEFITNFIETHGYSPSLEEVAKGLDLSSLATVHKHLTNLAEKGLIRRHWNRGRGIEIINDLAAPRLVQMDLDACYAIPIRGTVAAGQPLDVSEDDFGDRLSVPADLVRNAENTFVLRVRGDSMIEEGIQEGDFIICERRTDARNGQVVVALVGGYETTVKYFYREGDQVRLQPANPYMAPIYVRATDVAVQGVVIGLVRKYAV